MWIWRVVFKYTYILRDGEMEVISHGVGIRRSFKVDLTKTESYTNKYIKSFFKKTKIRHYIHISRNKILKPQPKGLKYPVLT